MKIFPDNPWQLSKRPRYKANLFVATIKDYCINSSLNGLHFIAEPDRHWTERVFWVICCLLSWYGCALMMGASWQAYRYHSISFAAETTYTIWQTDFPSVFVCEINNIDRITNINDKEFGDEREFMLDEIYLDIAYFSGFTNILDTWCFNDDEKIEEAGCPEGNFTALAKKYRSPCHDIFNKCTWNEKNFNCCDYFRGLETEVGVCFVINSIHTASDQIPPLDMTSNWNTGPGSLYMELNVLSNVYVLARQEVPLMNTITQNKISTIHAFHMKSWHSIKEVENDPSVRDVPIEQRGCRFQDENDLSVYQLYSYNGCITECRKMAQLRLCNCTSYQTPNIDPEEACGLEGMLCLHRNYLYLSILRHRQSFTMDKLFCPCMLSCEDQEIESTYNAKTSIPQGNVTILEISMTSLPTERFKRNVVRGLLDLVVSMGGNTGLFVGASLLSFMELLYYCTLRAYCTQKRRVIEAPPLPSARLRDLQGRARARLACSDQLEAHSLRAAAHVLRNSAVGDGDAAGLCHAAPVPVQSREMLLAVLKDYFVSASFHGLRFIAESDRHWTERLFWLACCLFSWYGSGMLIRSSWLAFETNAISFAAETTYIDWDTDFPSVSVCEWNNNDRIAKVRERVNLAEDLERNFDVDEVYKEITYFNGEATFIKTTCFEDDELIKDAGCPVANLRTIAMTYRTPCNETLRRCKWNNEPFNCCDHFLPLETELGICFSLNSINTKRKGPPLNFISNKFTGPGTLFVELSVASIIYVLARQDVPLMNTLERYKFPSNPNTRTHRWYAIKEVENDVGVRDLTLWQRGCRFPDENLLTVYDHYSYSGCLTECRKREMIRLCNCTSHQTPNADEQDTCDLKGLVCISGYYTKISVLRHRNSVKDTLFCPCMLSCEDMEINPTQALSGSSNTKDANIVEISMSSLPTERFKRNVVRGKLDLVVSMGGATSLLVGASLLSFVELIYYFSLRLYGTAKAEKLKKVSASGGSFQSTAPLGGRWSSTESGHM